MTDKEIFLDIDMSMIDEKYRYEIELLGKEKYFEYIKNFGGVTVYFGKPSNLTFKPIKEINRKNILKVKIEDLRKPYNEIAKIIGIEELYKLDEYNLKNVIYIPTINQILQSPKRQLIKKELQKATPINAIVAKYNVSARTILYIKYKIVQQEYKKNIPIFEICKKYNISEKSAQSAINRVNPLKKYI